ncbi:K02A2.6-like [Cordylochernes scorpioides]|uniref:K02A2.6-like n=1 Tax=Cordylochernes scorpioides TaxID=51811 RepID=A0ABY6KKI1_9ARAC|nr:K02A2.6-like [Cordylochernes scorpioides]
MCGTSKGIIMKETSPSRWISNMVIVKKPNKLNICIDLQVLNKAIKKSHYQMLTVEELLTRLPRPKYKGLVLLELADKLAGRSV